MARIDRVRKESNPNPNEIPAWLAEGVTLVDALQRSGVLDELGNRFHIQRQGGYCGLDVVLFLLLYFGCGRKIGIKGFYAAAKPWWRHLAAVANRSSLPSPPSMSRAMERVSPDEVRSLARWLFVETLEIGKILEHPSVCHHDATGHAWHVFDYDPTCTALRQRALPTRPGLPDADRRTDRLGAKPGRTGRKRGDVTITRSALQHAGCALWIDMQVEAGNGEPRRQLEASLDAAVSICASVGYPTERALVRLDGQFGGVPTIAAARQRGIRFVTRSSRYGLLDDVDIRWALRDAQWFMVADSGCGPQRSAANVGWVLLDPSSSTKREDGTPYASERVRLVITRYPAPTSKSAFRGHVVDGICYELLITDVDEEAWPPEAIASAYFARAGQENRFSQEDREIELDRIYAYDMAGQELASVIGSFVWNWRIVAGFMANTPPNVQPVQHAAAAVTDARAMPTLEPTGDTPPRPEPVDERALDEALPPVDNSKRREHLRLVREEMQKNMSGLFQGSYLEKQGWRLQRGQGAMVCPNGEIFTFQGLASHKGSFRAAFMPSPRACATCALATRCNKSERKFDYQPSLLVPPAMASRLLTPPELKLNPTKTPLPLVVAAARRRGHLDPLSPTFLPSGARRLARAIVGMVGHDITLPARQRPPRRHPLVAPDPRRLSHSRASLLVNLGRYALAADAVVRLQSTIPTGHTRVVAMFDAAIRSRSG